MDETVVFHSLDREHLHRIVDIQLDHLRSRLAERRIGIELTERAKAHFAQAGYDPTYGARPLKRLLQKEVETQLGRKIIAGEVGDNDRVVVDYDGNGLVIRAQPGCVEKPDPDVNPQP